MANRVRRSNNADADLTDIWVYVAQDSRAAADRLILDLIDAEDRLAEFPETGRARPEIRPGIRSWPVGAYILLYRIERDGILIVRIVHGARELRALLDDRDIDEL